MPAPNSIDAFLEIGYRSGLLEKAAAEAFCHQQPDVAAKSPKELAEVMIRSGLLTTFQAEKLLAGKWRGFVIGGKYRLLERLGAGGMGSVYLCEHVLMGRRVALKVLPIASRPRTPPSLARFYREARAVAAPRPPQHRPRLRHRPATAAPLPGHGVRRRRQPARPRQDATAPLPPPGAAHYIRQAALGLQHAHESRPGPPRHQAGQPARSTATASSSSSTWAWPASSTTTSDRLRQGVRRTARHRHRRLPRPRADASTSRVDIRADIYSLGGTLYYLLTGRAPFHEGTMPQKMIWHQVRQPSRCRTTAADVPEGLAARARADDGQGPGRPLPDARRGRRGPGRVVPDGPAAAHARRRCRRWSAPACQPSSHPSQLTTPRTPGTITMPGSVNVIKLPGSSAVRSPGPKKL